MVGQTLSFILFLYFLVLLGRLVFDWVQVFSRDWRPKGILLLVAEGIYSLTDPPLNALRKVIPPLRLGGVALDLGFLVLIFAVSIGRGLVAQLPF
ncbi:YggT family protein [Ornithinimicrobium sediminis]|uniref:YggT family protein n=1 Tax=Ornithinimicrobium sediminis TaxID=2904603 RepID=UPI001E4781AB|nr:YggT family protein [Ornithinimicrobium sediminis]MCE0488179.1 YggT family protein [Ornithinimicrobium sediminis]